jgi:cystathionine gamma-synthase
MRRAGILSGPRRSASPHSKLSAGVRGTIRRFLPELRLFSLAESPGGVEGLIAHPATMTRASMTPEARAEAGISDTLLRLSVGIEHAQDLVEHLRRH